MSQQLASDFPIDPVTTSGTALAQILNRFNDAVNTSNAGPSVPPETTPGMLWLDTSTNANGVLKMRNAANTAWITMSTPGGPVGLADGTAAAPGLAWTAEPSSGLFRAGAGDMRWSALGTTVEWLDASSATTTNVTIAPRAAGGIAQRIAYNQPLAAADKNGVVLGVAADGTGLLQSLKTGSATDKVFNFVMPAGAAYTGNVQAASFNVSVSSEQFSLSMDATFKYLRFAPSYAWYYNRTTGDLTWVPASNKNMTIAANGDLTVNGVGKNTAGGPWVAISDERVKENIQDYTAGLAEVLQLRPRTFRFRAQTGQDTARTYISLIAQEAKGSMPETVTVGHGSMGEIDLDDMHTLDTGPVTYALINAVKTLDARLAKLETPAP